MGWKPTYSRKGECGWLPVSLQFWSPSFYQVQLLAPTGLEGKVEVRKVVLIRPHALAFVLPWFHDLLTNWSLETPPSASVLGG